MSLLSPLSIFSLVFLLMSGSPPTVVSAEELAAVQVLNLVKAQENWEDEDAYVTFLMVNKKKEQVIRKARRLRKNYGKSGNLLRKTLLIFLYPPDNYREAYLDWYHMDSNNPHSIWMYSPDLRRTIRRAYQENERFLQRIFWGIDFTYGDFLERHLDRDDHRVLGIETLNYKECFVIESIPRKHVPINKAYPYSKRISWVWRDNWVLLKEEYYDSARVLIKTLNNHWEKIEGHWTLKQSLMKDHRKNHLTIVAITNVKYNTQLAERFFLPAQLDYTSGTYSGKR